MKYTKLGNSMLNVSRICLGCMGFGDPSNGQHTWTIGEQQTREVIRYAIDNGINFFDTAIGYQNGTSEGYVGKALKDFAKREDVIVATKFLPRSQAEITDDITVQEHIEKSINASLKHLNMDYVDLYIYHMWDYNSSIYEIMRTLHGIVKEGKARYIGISNCFAWQLVKANMIAEYEGLTKFISVQNHYNLIFREEERAMRDLCLEKNIAITPYSALASGRLSKRPDEDSKRLEEDSYARLKYSASAKQDAEIISRVMEISEKRNASMAEISLAWLLTKVTAPIVGATKKAHIDGMINAVNLKLTQDEISYLEERYVPHKLVGVMAQNTQKSANKNQVWIRGKEVFK